VRSAATEPIAMTLNNVDRSKIPQVFLLKLIKPPSANLSGQIYKESPSSVGLVRLP
jgi:hypothetical protein